MTACCWLSICLNWIKAAYSSCYYYYCAQLRYTIQHRTVFIGFQTTATAPTLSLIDWVRFNVPLNTWDKNARKVSFDSPEVANTQSIQPQHCERSHSDWALQNITATMYNAANHYELDSQTPALLQMQTQVYMTWKLGCSLGTSVHSELEIFATIALYKSTYTIDHIAPRWTRWFSTPQNPFNFWLWHLKTFI